MIIIRNSDGLVVFPAADRIDANGSSGNGWQCQSVTSADHTAIDAAPPEPWIPHGYIWTGDGYELTEIGAAELELLTQPVHDPVPSVVSRRQAKFALLQSGLLDDVDAAIATSGDRAAQIEWADAQEFRRDWTALVAMKPALGLTDAQVDDLFRLAATL